MPKAKALHDYRRDGDGDRPGVAYSAGQEFEVTEAEADWLLRDCPEGFKITGRASARPGRAENVENAGSGVGPTDTSDGGAMSTDDVVWTPPKQGRPRKGG